MPQLIAEVLLEISIRKPLDYLIPDGFVEVGVGSWVEVPLRQRISRGYVVSIKNSSSIPSLSSISRVLSDGPIITEDLFRLALWMASYYGTPIEKVLRTMLPSGVRKSVQRKKQFLISRAKTKEELLLHCRELSEKAPQQAKVLEILLQTKGGLLLSELAEKASCSPSVIKALEEKKLVTFDIVRGEQPLVVNATYFRTPPKALREEQQHALTSILSSLNAQTFSVKLLYGITGSGKTEVYMQAIEATLAQGKSALVLVPEIALTAQTIQRFQSRFDVPISVLHHRLSDGERHEAWSEIRAGRARIVIGARSAIFSPIPSLSLIIIDEEHEHSYKQSDDTPSYHARDVGVMRGKILGATVILGSATPSLESFYNASIKKYELLTLSDRGSASLPFVHIVDMRKEFEKAKGFTLFSDLLLRKIEEKVSRGEQVMLFLNRRGYHTTTTCTQCGTVVKCPHCDTALTFHRSQNLLSCHLCGYEMLPPTTCPSCKTPSMIRYKGIGTEKVEAMLHAIFPAIRVVRADADSTKHKGSLEQIFHAFRTGKADVLVGTQMIAKGHHFPEVTLVGILNCDGPLNIPDFRAQEMVFQLVTQVAGRAGRGFVPGEVILQTSVPEHPVIQAAARQDYDSFFKDESSIRETFLYPPYTHILKFVFVGEEKERVLEATHALAEFLQRQLPSQFICHAALPCGHMKISDKWRFQCLVRGPSVLTVTGSVEQFDKTSKLPSGVHRFCDVDPTSTFF